MEQPVPLPRAKSRSRLPILTQNQELDDDNGNNNEMAPTIVHTAEVHTVRADGGSSEGTDGEADSSAKDNMPIGKRRKKLKRRGTFLVRQNNTKIDDDKAKPKDEQEPSEVRRKSSELMLSKASSVESIRIPVEDTPSSATPKPSSQILGFGSEKKPESVESTSSVESMKEVEVFKIPAVPARRGSATETLSESSSGKENGKIKLKPLLQRVRRKQPSGYATETLSEDSSKATSPARVSSAPVPKPRKRLSISEHNVASFQDVRNLAGPIEIPTASVKKESSPVNKAEVEFESIRSQQSNQQLLSKCQMSPENTKEIPSQISAISERSNLETPTRNPQQGAEFQLETVENQTPDSPLYYTSSSVDYKDTGVVPPTRARKPKKKRKIKDNAAASSDISDQGSTTSLKRAQEQCHPNDEMVNKDTAICITVHRCEPLDLKDLHRRAFVRVSLMDTITRTYRRSAFGKNPVDVVQTREFDPILNRCVIPSWEEDLILMEPVMYVITAECVFIFELLEAETEELIAWAFLKPLAANGKKNIGSVLRLQLYKAIKSRSSKNEVPELEPFQWYYKNKLSPYKSTMMVSLHAIDSSLIINQLKDTTTGVTLSRGENHRRSSQMSTTANLKLSEAEKDLIGVIWSRLPALSCKLPTKLSASLPAGPDGGMSVKYSRSGLLVACHTSNTISVFTYKGSRYLTMSGHHGLVYDLSWSPDDSYLLSSSADTTSCVWNIKLKQSSPIAILNHPSYVYCCTWVGPNLAVTGCYDRAIRLWDLSNVTSSVSKSASSVSVGNLLNWARCDPLQCAISHKARVNTLAVLSSDETIVSGDSEGVLMFWKLSTTLPRQLELSREVKLRELRGQVINQVTAHPGGKRLLVATRDSQLRMVDMQTASIIQWFHGGLNCKLQCGSSFCGCGSRVLSCSEDGSVSVWDSNTGERVALYKDLYSPGSPATLDFHPKDNMFAVINHKVGAFPTLVLSMFSRDPSISREMGIKWLNERLDKVASSSSVSDLSLKSSHRSIETPPSSAGTRKKKKGILRALLQTGTRTKTKKGISNNAYSDTESGEVGRRGIDQQRKNIACRQILKDLEADGEVDHRLTGIIKQMDQLIMSASSPRLEVQ